VSIVSGASTLAKKGFSPNPINTKAGDNVTWVNDDTVFHTVTNTPFMVEKKKLERSLIQDYQDLLH
jgi:plastocyanin